MSLITIILTLIVVGVILWLINTYGAAYIAAPILKILNAVVIIIVLLWLLQSFGLLPFLNAPRVR